MEGLCLFLDIQLDIVCPDIPGEVSESGLCGPYLIINKSEGSWRPVFYVGLLKDRNLIEGHYQFLKKVGSEERRSLPQQLPTTPLKSPNQQSRISPQVQNSPSPLKVKRSRLISKYLQSPEKKSFFKEKDCKFCEFVAELGVDLEAHLTESSRCLKYYLRNFKVTSIMPVLLKLFNCHFCKLLGTNVKISNHLRRSKKCSDQYMTKFGSSNLKELQEKLEKIRRLLRPSAVNRKQELQKKRAKYEKIAQQKTENDLVNDYRKETSFSNCLLCHKC